MAEFTEAQKTRVLEAVGKHINANNGSPCPICGQRTWTVQGTGLVNLAITPAGMSGLVLGGPSLPGVAVVCQTCGNTHLLNVFVLGVADAFELSPSSKTKAAEPSPEVAPEPAPEAPTRSESS